jgi:hypothetical protein
VAFPLNRSTKVASAVDGAGGDHRPVAAAEEYLELLRAPAVSPNTVKSYARGLAIHHGDLGTLMIVDYTRIARGADGGAGCRHGHQRARGHQGIHDIGLGLLTIELR